MKHPAETKKLLTEVLAEATADEFRASLLEETLRLTRRRRGLRRAGRAGVACLTLVAIAWFAWDVLSSQSSRRSMTATRVISKPGCTIINTVPLPANALISTQLLGAGALVASAPGGAIVNTSRGAGFRVIDDEELLALAAPRRAALLRTGFDSQELIFLTPSEPRN